MRRLLLGLCLLALLGAGQVAAQDDIRALTRTREEIQAAVGAAGAGFGQLFMEHLRRQPQASSGRLVVSFTVAPDGRVTEAAIVSSPFADAELEAGVLAQFRQLRFEAREVPEFTHPGFPLYFALPKGNVAAPASAAPAAPKPVEPAQKQSPVQGWE